jgi:hypothetical protein
VRRSPRGRTVSGSPCASEVQSHRPREERETRLPENPQISAIEGRVGETVGHLSTLSIGSLQALPPEEQRAKATAAGRKEAAELDGELIASADEYHRLVAQDRAARANVRNEGVEAEQNYCDEAEAESGIWNRINDATDRVIMLPAATPEGLRAKASVLEQMMVEQHGEQIDEGRLDEDVALAWSLVCDITGRSRV